MHLHNTERAEFLLIVVFFPRLCRVLRRSCWYSTQCTCMCVRFACCLCARHIPNKLRLSPKRKQTRITGFYFASIKYLNIPIFFNWKWHTHIQRERKTFNILCILTSISEMCCCFSLPNSNFFFLICIHLSRKLIFFNQKNSY